MMYCLATTHDKCRTCQYEANWQTLNQLPDVLRKAIQKDGFRVDTDWCRLNQMYAYEPVK